MTELEQSYDYCRRVARTQARNFYYSFLLLPKPQRDAMCAVYAFMRRSDDLSDEPGAGSHVALEQWRCDFERAMQGDYPPHPCWRAFHHSVLRYDIPQRYFREMIDGVSSDLRPRQIETFDELYTYCYQVASVVGLTIVHIFGYKDQHALELAEKCGVAFQLTNIIRDVKEDQERGRCYLPEEDRERFGTLREVLEFEASRARAYYAESAPLVDMVSPESRASLWALMEIYRRLLRKIEQSGFDVMRQRIRLSTAEKAGIVARALVLSHFRLPRSKR